MPREGLNDFQSEGFLRTVKRSSVGPNALKCHFLFCCVCRVGSDLPEGVIPLPDGTLVFGRPIRMSDNGTYLCVAKNDLGVAEAKVEINVTGRRQHCQHHVLLLFVVITKTLRIV